MSCLCPASMCPLMAPNGSYWTGQKDAECPEHDDLNNKGCPWFSMACGVGGIHQQVAEAEANQGRIFVAGPNKPKEIIGTPKKYECKKELVCSWNKHSASKGLMCPPRLALSKGLDPRVCLF